MKKISLITLAVMVALVSLFYTSCKRPVHPVHPTPANNRLYSYTKFSTNSLIGSIPQTETFTFYYDSKKRVSQIYYSTDNQAKVINGTADLIMTFSYSNDTIYKTTTVVRTQIVIEQDFFIQNSNGFIIESYVPGDYQSFQYFGKLLTRSSRTVSDSGTSISASSIYTSDNGDLLNHTYDGILNVQFPDSGISFFQFPHDTDLTAPLTVTWTDFGTTPWTSTTHTVPGYSDALTNYSSGGPVAVGAVDGFGVVAYDTLIWPGGIWPRESYFVYPNLLDRTGDYMQIEAFTMWGVNIYQNTHLIKYIVEQGGPKTEVLYTIDADSKITQTYVTKTFDPLSINTTVYKFQYQTF